MLPLRSDMKFKLKEFFSIEKDGQVTVGPCEIELDEKQAELEKHKIEEIVEKKKASKPEDK